MCCKFEQYEEEWMVKILHHRCWQGDGINLPMCPVSGIDQERMSANLPTWQQLGTRGGHTSELCEVKSFLLCLLLGNSNSTQSKLCFV